MDLQQYVQIAWKQRWILLAGLLVGLAAGAYAVTTSETSYRGEVTFFVSTAGEGTASSANVADQFALRRVNSYLALLSTDRLARQIVDDTGLDTTPGYVSSLISGSGDIDTVLLRANVQTKDREVAMVLAESLSREFVELVSDVERPLAGEDTVRLELVSGPSVSSVPIRSRLIIASRLAAGLLIAAIAALVRELLDNRVRSAEQIALLTTAPILGVIADDKRVSEAPLTLREDSQSVRAEAYRQLRTNLQFVDREHAAQVIAVTSSVPGEGKSLTAANLAISLAHSGQRVLLVDADLRRPTLADLFSLEETVGLTDVLLGRMDVEDAIDAWGTSSLDILTSGEIPPNPAELLGTVGTRRLLEQMRERYDTVVVDTPPLLPVTDAAVISTQSDGVVVVAGLDRITRGQLQKALGLLDRVDARLLGFVASKAPSKRSEIYSRYQRDVEPSAPTLSSSRKGKREAVRRGRRVGATGGSARTS